MLEREGFIHGVPCWVDSGRLNADSAVAFYGGLFGWEFTDINPEGEGGLHRPERRRLCGLAARVEDAVGFMSEKAWGSQAKVDPQARPLPQEPNGTPDPLSD